MDPRTLEVCLDMLEAMPSGRDQDAKWSQLRKLYVLALRGLQSGEAKAAVEFAALREQWRPSPARLLDIASEQASPLPSDEDAYAEIVRKVQTEGLYAAPHPDRPSIRLEGPPPFSHPIIGKIVHYCGGWPMVCGGESNYAEGLKKQVRSAHETLSKEWREKVKAQLAQPDGKRDRRLFPDWKPFELPSEWTPDYKLPAIEPPHFEAPKLCAMPERVRAMIAGVTDALPSMPKEPSITRQKRTEIEAELAAHRERAAQSTEREDAA